MVFFGFRQLWYIPEKNSRARIVFGIVCDSLAFETTSASNSWWFELSFSKLPGGCWLGCITDLVVSGYAIDQWYGRKCRVQNGMYAMGRNDNLDFTTHNIH